jgi:hypothetical protein
MPRLNRAPKGGPLLVLHFDGCSWFATVASCRLPLAFSLSCFPPPWLSSCFFLVRCGCSVLFGFVLYFFMLAVLCLLSVSISAFRGPPSFVCPMGLPLSVFRWCSVIGYRLHIHMRIARPRPGDDGGWGWGWGMGMGRARGGVARCTWVLGPCALCLGPNSPTGCAYGPLKPARAGYGLGRQRLGLRTRTRVLK